MRPVSLAALLVTSVAVVWASLVPTQSDILIHETVTSAAVSRAEWLAYKAKHGKAYSDDAEEAHRLRAYAANKAFVERHNAEHARGLHTYTVALNKLADLTPAEYAARYTSSGRYNSSSGGGGVRRAVSRAAVSGADLPAELDWRLSGAVTPVADQAGCSAAWAFSATGVLESARAAAGAPLVELSAQQIIDCDVLDGVGCDGGGRVFYALHYTELVNGIEPNATYPFTAETGRCVANQNNFINDMDYFIQISGTREDLMQEDIVTLGPISATVDAGHQSFQLYESGVYYEPKCHMYPVNHPMLVVGYGATEGGQEYWIVKNCWGTGWGEDGFIRMTRNMDNHCGITTEAYYVVTTLNEEKRP